MKMNRLSFRPRGSGIIPRLVCGVLVVLGAFCASAELKHCGYWLHGKTMKDVDVRSLVSFGTTDVILHEYAFKAHGQKDVEEWIAQADAAGLKVHIWMQVFYNGKWINPVKDGVPDEKLFDEKIKRAQSYARMRGVAGIHFDYVRYPGTAYKTPGGAEAVSEFVRLAATQLHQTSPKIIVSVALMPETTANKHYYGQDYEAITQYMDVVVPMIYKGNYKKTTDWIASTTKWFVANSKGAKVWAGLQGYKSDEDTSKLPASEITADVEAALKAGADGAVIFRWGVTNFVIFPYGRRDARGRTSARRPRHRPRATPRSTSSQRLHLTRQRWRTILRQDRSRVPW